MANGSRAVSGTVVDLGMERSVTHARIREMRRLSAIEQEDIRDLVVDEATEALEMLRLGKLKEAERCMVRARGWARHGRNLRTRLAEAIESIERNNSPFPCEGARR
jgi:hypothetical protein